MHGLPKMIATDLDGTLLHPDGSVSAYTRRVLNQARERGVTVVGVTGRGRRIMHLAQGRFQADYMVMGQGGHILRTGDPAPLWVSPGLSGVVALDAIARLEALAGPVNLVVEVSDIPGTPLWAETVPVWPWVDVIEARGRAGSLAGSARKIFVLALGQDSELLYSSALAAIPPELCQVHYGHPGMIELSEPDVTKAAGLARVAANLDIDPANVLVFGDMPNDLSMFAWAGQGVAVANAHPELIAAAHAVTAANTSDGVAQYIETLLATVPA